MCVHLGSRGSLSTQVQMLLEGMPSGLMCLVVALIVTSHSESRLEDGGGKSAKNASTHV